MSDRRDRLYAEPQSDVEAFVFDGRVAAVFPDMIRRSVPGYGTIVPMIGMLARRYAQPGSRIYDLGCSLGAATLAIRAAVRAPDLRIVAVDNSPEMIAGLERVSKPGLRRYCGVQDIPRVLGGMCVSIVSPTWGCCGSSCPIG